MLTAIERAAIDGHRRSLDAAPPTDAGADDVALYLGIRLLLEAGQLVRERRGKTAQAGVTIKEDGSPATEVEHRIESRLRSWLSAVGSDAVVVGEETGGVLPTAGTAIAIDPIDGTRAFLAETETYSTTLALIRDGEVVLGMVSNPTAGEIAYAVAGGASRLIRLSTFGEPDEAGALKRPSTPERPLLVNFHPSRRGADCTVPGDSVKSPWFGLPADRPPGLSWKLREVISSTRICGPSGRLRPSTWRPGCWSFGRPGETCAISTASRSMRCVTVGLLSPGWIRRCCPGLPG